MRPKQFVRKYYKEIAQWSGLSENTVYSRGVRGIPRTRIRLIQEYIEYTNDENLDIVLKLEEMFKNLQKK